MPQHLRHLALGLPRGQRIGERALHDHVAAVVDVVEHRAVAGERPRLHVAGELQLERPRGTQHVSYLLIAVSDGNNRELLRAAATCRTASRLATHADAARRRGDGRDTIPPVADCCSTDPLSAHGESIFITGCPRDHDRVGKTATETQEGTALLRPLRGSRMIDKAYRAQSTLCAACSSRSAGHRNHGRVWFGLDGVACGAADRAFASHAPPAITCRIRPIAHGKRWPRSFLCRRSPPAPFYASDIGSLGEVGHSPCQWRDPGEPSCRTRSRPQ